MRFLPFKYLPDMSDISTKKMTYAWLTVILETSRFYFQSVNWMFDWVSNFITLQVWSLGVLKSGHLNRTWLTSLLWNIYSQFPRWKSSRFIAQPRRSWLRQFNLSISHIYMLGHWALHQFLFLGSGKYHIAWLFFHSLLQCWFLRVIRCVSVA